MYNLYNTGCVNRNRCGCCGCGGNTWGFQRICRDCQGNIRVINNCNNGCGCNQGWNNGCSQGWNNGCSQGWNGGCGHQGGFSALVFPIANGGGTGYNGCQRTCGSGYNGCQNTSTRATTCGGCVNALTVTNDVYYARLYGLTGRGGTTRCGCNCGNAYLGSTAYTDVVDAMDD